MRDEATISLVERFHRFEDGLLRSVFFTRGRGKDSVSVLLEISGRDQLGDTSKDSGWANVVVRLERVSEFRFTESSKDSNWVLSGGIYVSMFRELQFVTLNEWDAPADEQAARQASCYVAAASLRWKVVPYSDYGSLRSPLQAEQ